MDVETTEAIERVNESVTDLRAEMRQGFAEVRAEMREGLEEAKRYSLILHEDLKDDIRILAEGVASLSTRIDTFRR